MLDKYQKQVLASHSGYERGSLLTDPQIVILSFGMHNNAAFEDFDQFLEEARYFCDRLIWTFPNAELVFRTSNYLRNPNRILTKRYENAMVEALLSVGVHIWDVYGLQSGLPSEWSGRLEHEENLLLMNLISNFGLIEPLYYL